MLARALVVLTELPSDGRPLPAFAGAGSGEAGTECPPLVATSGWPNSARMLLVRHLASAGGTLDYHGDLDGEGARTAAEEHVAELLLADLTAR
jgi:hypothetical protein